MRDTRKAQENWTSELTKISDASRQLCKIEWDMKAWRRTYRKQYGKTANPEDFLLDNATRIRKALTQFEAAYADWVKYMNETHSSVDIAELVETHYQRIDNMWPLDVEDTEAREIERMSQRLQSVEELQEKQAKAARRAERRKQFN